jgi:hypothetical protein
MKLPVKSLLVLLFALQVSAWPFERRSGPDDAGEVDIAYTLDGATSDKSAGMGVEFEAGAIAIAPTDATTCTQDLLNGLKGKGLAGRSGTNWKLTVDTTSPQELAAEYILDGTSIKLGTGAAGQAASDIATDLVRLHCSADPIVIYL